MAKRTAANVEENLDLTDPNAPQKGDKPVTWSVEDLTRLDAQYTDLAQAHSDLRAQFESLQARFIHQEALLSKIDLGEGILPAEIVDGVSPAQLYMASVQACLIANAIANPVGMVNESSRSANMRRIYDIAEMSLNESLRRSAIRKKR